MSKWDKLIQAILAKKANLRFEDLASALTKIGYTQEQPRGGSSHYTFRKEGCMPITLPKKKPPIDKVYIRLVSAAVEKYYDKEDASL